jgi:hypothetical protein
LARRETLEREAPLYLGRGTYTEPFALRALALRRLRKVAGRVALPSGVQTDERIRKNKRIRGSLG